MGSRRSCVTDKVSPPPSRWLWAWRYFAHDATSIISIATIFCQVSRLEIFNNSICQFKPQKEVGCKRRKFSFKCKRAAIIAEGCGGAHRLGTLLFIQLFLLCSVYAVWKSLIQRHFWHWKPRRALGHWDNAKPSWHGPEWDFLLLNEKIFLFFNGSFDLVLSKPPWGLLGMCLRPPSPQPLPRPKRSSALCPLLARSISFHHVASQLLTSLKLMSEMCYAWACVSSHQEKTPEMPVLLLSKTPARGDGAHRFFPPTSTRGCHCCEMINILCKSAVLPSLAPCWDIGTPAHTWLICKSGSRKSYKPLQNLSLEDPLVSSLIFAPEVSPKTPLPCFLGYCFSQKTTNFIEVNLLPNNLAVH